MKLPIVALATVIAGTTFLGRPIAQGPMCQLDRQFFELLVSVRMQNYEATGDSWSDRAARWRDEISGNIAAGRATPSLDDAFARYGRYCAEEDDFMAGLTVGEWVGIGLRAP